VLVDSKNTPTHVFDKHFTLRCPHCGAVANLSAVSIPRYEYLERFRPKKTGVAYRCDACNSPVFLRFSIAKYDVGNHRIVLGEEFEVVERPREQFEFNYLTGEVKADFAEALDCYANGSLNAFAAMCRRTVQSMCSDLGAKGKDRVLSQLQDLKATAEIDDETFTSLSQVVVDGHDGAHPHLPKLNEGRAAVLLELMKDVMYQVYVRKAKLQEAMALRKQAIEAGRSVP